MVMVLQPGLPLPAVHCSGKLGRAPQWSEVRSFGAASSSALAAAWRPETKLTAREEPRAALCLMKGKNVSSGKVWPTQVPQRPVISGLADSGFLAVRGAPRRVRPRVTEMGPRRRSENGDS